MKNKINNNSNNTNNNNRQHNVRIIGGMYKSSKIDVLNIDGLRPTPDRLRETIFNWLGDISDLNCLDMFAGSGAFGFECLSRQAKYVLMLEKNKHIYNNLKSVQEKLKISNDNIDIMNADSLLYINNNRISKKFDLVFLDPPYASNLLELALPMVRSIISENGLIYIEDNKNLAGLNSDLGLDLISKNNLAIYKHTKMGQIYAYLLKSAL